MATERASVEATGAADKAVFRAVTAGSVVAADKSDVSDADAELPSLATWLLPETAAATEKGAAAGSTGFGAKNRIIKFGKLYTSLK